MSGNSAAFAATFACALALAGSGWNGAAAQGAKAPETRSEAQSEIRRAQRELTAAEAVLRDARDASAKIESAAGETLARIDERRRNANAIPDDVRRSETLRAIAAEEKRVRDDIATARAAETVAERNAENAALALARARSGSRAPKDVPTPRAAPKDTPKDMGTKVVPAPTAAPTPSGPAGPPPTPAAAPPAALEALVLARMDVEAAETAFARAKAAREEAERATADQTRELARMLAETVELKKHAEGARATEAAELEASLKIRIQNATAKLGDARAREAEAKAALDSARDKETKARAEVEARIPAR
jgi:hypothetical protein